MNTKFRLITAVFGLFLLINSTSFSQTGDLQKAISLYNAGNFEEAGKQFDIIIVKGNASKDVFTAAVDCALQLKNYKKAISLLEQAIAKFGSDYSYQLTLAQLLAETGNHTKAITTLQNLIKSYPDSSSVRLLLSDVFLMSGVQLYNDKNFEQAGISLKSSLTNNPKNKDARRNLIVVYLLQKKYKEALPFAQDGYSLYPSDKIFRKLYFETLVGNENYEEAIKISQHIAKVEPDDMQNNLNLAMLYRYMQDGEKAYSQYAELRKKFPKAKEVYKAEIDFLELNRRYDLIIDRYTEFLSQTPDDVEMMLGLGKTYENKKSYDTARTIYSELVAKDLYRDAQLLIAESYVKEGRNKEAIQMLEEYIVSGGKNPDAFERITGLLNLSGDKQRAREFLLTAVKVHPGKTVFVISLVKQYYYSGDRDSSMIWLERVKQNFIEFPDISYYTALIHADRKDTSRAVFHFNRAVRYLLERSQRLQAEILSSVSGSNINNPDSIDRAKTSGNELDTVSTILKDSFRRLKSLMSFAEYLAALKKMIADLPQAGLLYMQRGLYLSEAGQFKEAGEDFEAALLLSPSSDEVQSAAGDFYEANGQEEKALMAFRKASSLNKKEHYYYRKIIDLSQKLGSLNEICDYWFKLYETDRKNSLLREHLIEVLHKAGRMKEAEKIINDFE